jgi:hypothetical protein
MSNLKETAIDNEVSLVDHLGDHPSRPGEGGHLAAQRAVVRMLFDPEFARAVRERPAEVLPRLDPALRAQLSAIDDRALRRDRARRRRALGTLFQEWKASTVLALLATRSYAFLEAFFASAHFHSAVEERGSMPFAYAAYLADAAVGGQLASRWLPDVLQLETAMARARRAPESEPTDAPASVSDDTLVALAPGVLSVTVPSSALAALQAIETWLFEAGLLPPLALCDDAPAPVLPLAEGEPVHLFVVARAEEAQERAVSLVSVEEPLAVIARCLAAPRRVREVVAEAVARGLSADHARAVLEELHADELVVSHG